MTGEQRIEKARTEPVDETLLERPAEALVNRGVYRRRQAVGFSDKVLRLTAAGADAQETSRRHASAIEAGEAVGGGLVHILYEDPELASALPMKDARDLMDALRAPVITIRESPWHPPAYDPDRTYGLLMLEGLLGKRVILGAATTIELLGHGDILRPWQTLPDTLIPASVEWRVLSPVRMAVLDERITAAISRRPELIVAFASRFTRRCHAATYLAAIGHIGRVEDRLLAIMWHIAGNWGRVTPNGVRIPFRLTHEILGELVGAKRPSVTIGLSNLRQQGEIAQSRDGQYVLTGSPPQWRSDS